MSSDHSSEPDYNDESKTEFLEQTIGELATYIAPCEAWLTMQRLVVSDFEYKTVLENLITQVAEYIQSCKLLRVHCELLLRFRSHLLFIEEWHSVKSRMFYLSLDMQSLDWRCENAGVPIIELA